MLACARIGRPFGGVRRFSPSARGRIEDAGSDIVVTADEGLRAASACRSRPMSTRAGEGRGQDRARRDARRRGGYGEGPRLPLRDEWKTVAKDCPYAEMARKTAVHPLHSGSTGKPKGVLHTTAAILFMPRSRINSCSIIARRRLLVHADVGWVTATVIFSMAARNGATTLMFEACRLPTPRVLGGRR